MAAMIEKLLGRLMESDSFGIIRRNDYSQVLSAKDMVEEARAVGEFRCSDFIIDEGLAFAYDNIARWFVGDAEMRCLTPMTKLVMRGDLTKGIYLAGRTGCGKSWAMEIFSFLCREHNMRMIVGTRQVPLCPRAFRADEITSRYMKDGDLTLFVNEPSLLIHDLGTEPQEVLYMGNRVDVVRQVLEQRADATGRVTFVTSNIPMGSEGLRERYGDRVVSRLSAMFNYIEIKGNDKRL